MMAALLYAGKGWAQNTTASAEPALKLVSGDPLTLQIPVQSSRTVSFSLCSGCFADVEIEQLDGMISAYRTGPGIGNRFAYYLDAGVHSVVHIPVLASAQATYRIEIDPALGRPATVCVTLTPPHAAGSGDSARVATSEQLADAATIHRSRTPGSGQKAAAAYEQALAQADAIGDERLQLQALLGEARVSLYRTGDYKAALRQSLAAITIVNHWDPANQTLEDVALEAYAWKQVSSAYAFLAQYPKMIDATNHSLDLYRKLGDLYWQGILEGNAANVYIETGDMQHALFSAEQALKIARELSDTEGVVFADATLAMVHQERGEYQAAFDADGAALTAMPSGDEDERGQIWMNLAELYNELNDPERQADMLHRSLLLLQQAGDTANESAALCDLGLLELHRHQLAAAEASIDKAMAITSAHSLAREESYVWLAKAQLLAAQKKTTRALAAIQSGQALASRTKEVATSALLAQEQGDLQTRIGQAADAVAAYRRAESIWSGIPNLEHASLARASIARSELHSGNFGAAHDDLLAALAGFEASRRSIGERSLRESFFASVHDFYDLGVQIDAGQGAEEEAWQIAERARARSLMDAIRNASDFSMQDIPGSLLEQSASIEQRIQSAQLAVSRLGAGNDSAPLRLAAGRLHALVLEAENVEAQEREVSPSLFSSGTHPAALSVVQSELLSPDAALLEYWIGRDSVDLWVITRAGLRMTRPCSAQKLNVAVREYQHLLLAREIFPPGEDFSDRSARIARADRALDQQAAELGKLLLPPHLSAGVHRLIIVPDGVLASLPFAALRIGSGDYLIHRYEVLEEPSASVAVDLATHPTHSRGPDLAAVFADPVYNRLDPRLTHGEKRTDAQTITTNSAPRTLRSGFDLDLSNLPRLSASQTEATAIALIAGSGHVRSFLGFAATPEQVMHLSWSGFSIAHFATHAIVDSTHPELSGIVLSTYDPAGRRQNGVLWLHDIYRTPFPVPLVVLSGCRTASGKSIPGEGISGLAQAFLSSGASGVIGALWSVDDTAAGKMMPSFYRALLGRHDSISAALRAAQLRMVEEHQPPYDWAGYVVEGNGSASVALP